MFDRVSPTAAMIYKAIQDNDVTTLRDLMQLGVNLNPHGDTFERAVASGHRRVISFLLLSNEFQNCSRVTETVSREIFEGEKPIR